MTINMLSVITGREPRTIRDRITGLQTVGVKGKSPLYDSKFALPLIYGTGEDEETQRQKSADAARRAKSEANMAQLDEAKMIRELVPIEEARRLINGAIVKTRENVRRLKGLTAAQKQAVCAIFAGNIKLAE